MVKKGQVPVILKWGIGAIEGAIEEDIERTYGGLDNEGDGGGVLNGGVMKLKRELKSIGGGDEGEMEL